MDFWIVADSQLEEDEGRCRGHCTGTSLALPYDKQPQVLFYFIFLLNLFHYVKVLILNLHFRKIFRASLYVQFFQSLSLAAKKVIAMHVMGVTNLHEVLPGVSTLATLATHVRPKGVKKKRGLTPHNQRLED